MHPMQSTNRVTQRTYPEIIIIEDEPEVVVKQEPGIKEETKKEERNQKIKQVGRRSQWKPKEIKMSELEGTLTSKMVQPKDEKRVHTQSHQEVKDKQKNIIAFAKQTLKEANTCWDNRQYGQAANLYSQVAYYGGMKSHLAKASYIQVFRDLYLSHFEQWKTEESLKEKAAFIEDARYSLDHYLKEETNEDLRLTYFRNFSETVFEEAVKLVHDHCEISFEHWTSLFTIYLDHQALVGKESLNNCVDDVLFNMTVCIGNLVPLQLEGSAELVGRMKTLLGHASLPQNLKEQYMKWLSSDWSDQSAPNITTETVKKKKDVISPADEGDSGGDYDHRVDASEETESTAVFLATVAEEPESVVMQERVVPKTGDLLVDWLIGEQSVQYVPMQAPYAVNNHLILMASPLAFGNDDGPQPLFVGPQPLNVEEELETAKAMYMLANGQYSADLNPKRGREFDVVKQDDEKRRKF